MSKNVSGEYMNEASPHMPASIEEVLPIGLQDLEQLRLVLRGNSALDWRRLSLRSSGEALQLLKLAGIDLRYESDRAHLRSIYGQALDYLDSQLSHFVSNGVRQLERPEELLMLASKPGILRDEACIILKVMHVIHHVAGRELLHRLPVSTQDLFYKIEQRVFNVIDGMRASGIRITQFEGSRKTHSSIVTKLLCRSDSLATEVHDRIRFRIITEDLPSLFEALNYMTRHLFPFNYVVPGESRNDLLDLEASIKEDEYLTHLAMGLQSLSDRDGASNPHSAKGFRMINFVVDLPVRIDDELWMGRAFDERLGNTVFLLVEFQLIDQETHTHNNTGDNRHALYKERQLKKVLDRLTMD
jgi:uncharacterized protein (TIGR04552 family)